MGWRPSFGGDQAAPAGYPRTEVRIVSSEDIDAHWRPEEAVSLLDEPDPREPARRRTVDRHPLLGYRLSAPGFGRARISTDGAQVLGAPDGPQWPWERFVFGRVLPWAALLSGREVLHASALGLDEAAIALVGTSGAGKTSLAVRIVLAGGQLVSDDVLALELAGDDVLAHPGAPLLSVRRSERAALTDAEWRRLGRVVAEDDKLHLEPQRRDTPVPLRALYFLASPDRLFTLGVEPGDDRIAAIGNPDPRLLLGSTFVFSHQAPSRLRNLLDISAGLADRVELHAVSVVPGQGSSELADAVLSHARSAVARARPGSGTP